MKTAYSKLGMYSLVLLMFFAISSCNEKEKSSSSSKSGVAVKVKASKF